MNRYITKPPQYYFHSSTILLLRQTESSGETQPKKKSQIEKQTKLGGKQITQWRAQVNWWHSRCWRRRSNQITGHAPYLTDFPPTTRGSPRLLNSLGSIFSSTPSPLSGISSSPPSSSFCFFPSGMPRFLSFEVWPIFYCILYFFAVYILSCIITEQSRPTCVLRFYSLFFSLLVWGPEGFEVWPMFYSSFAIYILSCISTEQSQPTCVLLFYSLLFISLFSVFQDGGLRAFIYYLHWVWYGFSKLMCRSCWNFVLLMIQNKSFWKHPSTTMIQLIYLCSMYPPFPSNITSDYIAAKGLRAMIRFRILLPGLKSLLKGSFSLAICLFLFLFFFLYSCYSIH